MKKTEEEVREAGMGAMIRELREEQGITQEQLCEGLCALPTLSRIETGKQQPSWALGTVLLQRLGMVEEHSYLWGSLEDRALGDLKQQVKRANGRLDHKAAIELLDVLEAKCKGDDSITRQFIRWSRAANGRLVEGVVSPYPAEQRLEMLNEAIRCTVPKFDGTKIARHLLCVDEAIIVVNIANQYASMGEPRTALGLYQQLLDYVDERLLPLTEGGFLIPLITYNYSKYLGKANRSEEELEIAERGIACCVAFGRSNLIGELYINKACALHRLGREEEGKEAAILSCYVLRALEKWDSVQTVKEYLKATYGVCLP